MGEEIIAQDVFWALAIIGVIMFPVALALRVALTIGAARATIVAAIFMELRHRDARTLIFAGAGLFWLSILLWLGSLDFLTPT